MRLKFLTCAAGIIMITACQSMAQTTFSKNSQSDEEIANCIRTVMALEVGRWNYMGTIAQIRGKFRTYEAIFVYAEAGPDMWSFKAFGGDVGGDENSAEVSYTKLVGTTLFSVENGELTDEGAHKVSSCVGPDAEGRYELHQNYKVSSGEGTYSTSKNMTWYSEHGSYYAEDFFAEDGRVTSRRSGVNTPFNQTVSAQGG
ncbi:MAG: hypothetical protein ABJN69_01580 [Hellea sp.]